MSWFDAPIGHELQHVGLAPAQPPRRASRVTRSQQHREQRRGHHHLPGHDAWMASTSSSRRWSLLRKPAAPGIEGPGERPVVGRRAQHDDVGARRAPGRAPGWPPGASPSRRRKSMSTTSGRRLRAASTPAARELFDGDDLEVVGPLEAGPQGVGHHAELLDDEDPDRRPPLPACRAAVGHVRHAACSRRPCHRRRPPAPRRCTECGGMNTENTHRYHQRRNSSRRTTAAGCGRHHPDGGCSAWQPPAVRESRAGAPPIPTPWPSNRLRAATPTT